MRRGAWLAGALAARVMPPDLVSALLQASKDAAKQADYVDRMLAQWSARYPRGYNRERVSIQDIGFKLNGGQCNAW